MKGFEFDNTAASLLVTRGELLQRTGNLDAALSRELAAAQPRLALAHKHLGEIHRARAEGKEALYSLATALHLAPVDRSVILSIGLPCEELAAPKVAVELFSLYRGERDPELSTLFDRLARQAAAEQRLLVVYDLSVLRSKGVTDLIPAA
uniref:Uncharacterized protein n=1 Tax=Geobacter sp. (strain M21) TaxID=443144 RepID=C6E7H6_GEOSM